MVSAQASGGGAVVAAQASDGGDARLSIFVAADEIKPHPLQLILSWKLEQVDRADLQIQATKKEAFVTRRHS